MSNSNQVDRSDSQWEACASGTLRQFSKSERNRQFRRKSYTVGGVAAVCCLVVSGIASLPNTDVRPLPIPSHVASEADPFGGMYCSEVISELDSFLAGQLPDGMRGPLKRHLQDCEKCRTIFEKAAAERGITITQRKAEHARQLALLRQTESILEPSTFEVPSETSASETSPPETTLPSSTLSLAMLSN